MPLLRPHFGGLLGASRSGGPPVLAGKAVPGPPGGQPWHLVGHAAAVATAGQRGSPAPGRASTPAGRSSALARCGDSRAAGDLRFPVPPGPAPVPGRAAGTAGRARLRAAPGAARVRDLAPGPRRPVPARCSRWARSAAAAGARAARAAARTRSRAGLTRFADLEDQEFAPRTRRTREQVHADQADPGLRPGPPFTPGHQ